jgi:hypothetical protein
MSDREAMVKADCAACAKDRRYGANYQASWKRVAAKLAESSPGNRRALPRLKQSSIGAVDSLIVGTVCAAVQKHRECFNRSGTKRKRQFSTGFDVVYGYPLMPDL